MLHSSAPGVSPPWKVEAKHCNSLVKGSRAFWKSTRVYVIALKVADRYLNVLCILLSNDLELRQIDLHHESGLPT